MIVSDSMRQEIMAGLVARRAEMQDRIAEISAMITELGDCTKIETSGCRHWDELSKQMEECKTSNGYTLGE
jgi:hypothetical protein